MKALIRFNVLSEVDIDQNPSYEEHEELMRLVKENVCATVNDFFEKLEQQEQPKSDFNAKIVCTNPKASKVFEKGKVYDVVNGYIYHKGKPIEQPRVFENFEELQDHAIADFVELRDE